jgi:glycyl-tRNA synthetase
MAEIEHYVDPLDKVHPRFDEVRNVVLTLLPKDVQMEGRTETTQMTVGEAVEKKIVDNETLGYFLARTQLFLVKIGMDATRVRCRQHMANEMAHYAAVSGPTFDPLVNPVRCVRSFLSSVDILVGLLGL